MLVAEGQTKLAYGQSSCGVTECGHELVVVGHEQVSFQHFVLVSDLKDGTVWNYCQGSRALASSAAGRGA